MPMTSPSVSSTKMKPDASWRICGAVGSRSLGLASYLRENINCLVTKFRQSRGFAVAIITTLVVAWLFASNHCALAAVENPATSASDHACCHSDKGTSQLPGQTVQCCKALAAPIPDALAAPAVHLQELKPAWLQGAQIEASSEASILAVDFASETGPPRNALSFALLILNRSLLAHAPPHFVA
jgi:hypothetical protein